MKKMAAVVTAVILAVVCVAGAAQNYVQDAGVVAWSNSTGSAVNSGDIVDIGDRYGVCLTDIGIASNGSVRTDGVWNFRKHSTGASTSAIVQGKAIYYQSATSVTVVGAAGTYLGRAVESTVQSKATNGYIKVELDKPQNAVSIEVGTGTNGQTDIDFDAAFSAAPQVWIQWNGATEGFVNQNAGTNCEIKATTVTVTNSAYSTQVPVNQGLTNFMWRAEGLR